MAHGAQELSTIPNRIFPPRSLLTQPCTSLNQQTLEQVRRYVFSNSPSLPQKQNASKGKRGCPGSIQPRHVRGRQGGSRGVDSGLRFPNPSLIKEFSPPLYVSVPVGAPLQGLSESGDAPAQKT
ncbi:hypothetical protein TNIN_24691 [Trichonephila inaurata madagascariensis]|uniref:Uncharacterized protein n=1 Tax=Trichonephila inaurata madagascariensis TaxID=2747483 RepID=A0A8X6IME5_9ARAC|nr:hypothetical protein TNIN_24691 [Trichonephila inaurata madagascariensis]